MPGPVPAVPAGQPSRDDLAALLFRALYKGFDLHTAGGIHVAVPKGTPCFAGSSLSEVNSPRRGDARQTGPST